MTDPHAVPRDSWRVPIETRVQLSFERFSGFISEYSSNISPGGMFIRTREPQPPGTVLGFELRLGDGYELIRGRGEVIWSREADESAERRAGMGIRFLELSPGSRELIYRIVDQHIQEGGTPFDLAAPAAPVPPHPPGLETAAFGRRGALPGSTLLAAVPKGKLPARPSAPRSAGPPPDSAPAAVLPAGSGPSDVVAASREGIFGLPAGLAAPEPRLPEPGPVQAAAASSSPAPAAFVPPASLVPPVPSAGARPGSWPEPLRAAAAGAAGAGPSFPPAAPIPEAPPPLREPARPAVRRGVLRWGALAALLVLAILGFLNQEKLLLWVMRREAASAPSPLPVPGGPAARPPRPPRPPRPITEVAPAAGDAAVPAAAALDGPAAAGNGEASTVSGAAGAPALPARPEIAERAAAAATEIERITWEQEAGGTQVVLWGNGSFSRQSYVHLRIDGEPPRELIRLVHVRRPFAERLTVGTRQVRQVRTGLHSQPAGAELHVVLDLAGPGIEITGIDVDERRLRIHLQGE